MERVGMDLVTVAASVGPHAVVGHNAPIVACRSSGVGVITEPIYVDSAGATADELHVSSTGGTPPGLQLTTITVAVPAGPLSPHDHHAVGSSVGGVPISVGGVPNALLHSAPLPTVPLPVVPAPPHECATLKWKNEISPTKEKNASGGGGGLVSLSTIIFVDVAYEQEWTMRYNTYFYYFNTYNSPFHHQL